MLHAAGRRFRVDYRITAGEDSVSADIVFTRQRVAVFCDGCYWHGCPRHGRLPNTNQHYWRPKLLRNKIRDRTATRALRSAGWRVLRFWEHESPQSIVRRIERMLEEARA